MDPNQKAAEEILEHTRAVYQPQHDYVTADPDDFKHLDLKWYERSANRLRKLGFQWLGDQEDRTITNAPGGFMKPVMLRVLVSSDGVIVATLYHPKPVFWLRVLLFLMRKSLAKTIDFESELEDGSFISTSNAEAASAMQLPPRISMQYMPKGTTLEALYACHKETVSRSSQKSFKRFQCLEDIIQSQDRMNAMKAEFREQIGGISREEIERSVGHQSDTINAVYDQIQEIRTRENKEPQSGSTK